MARLILLMLIPVAAAVTCPEIYTPDAANKGCLCKPGYASYIPTWTTDASYPSQPPACTAHTPAKDPNYSSGMKFPTKVGKCFCFRCPSGYSSLGNGPLNGARSACVKVTSFYAQLTLKTSSGSVCQQSVVAAVTASLTASLKKGTGIADPSTEVVSTGCGRVKDASTTTKTYKINLAFRYLSAKTDVRTEMIKKLSAKTRAFCSSFDVCNAVSKASGSKDKLTKAVAKATSYAAIPTLPCSPPACNDRPCNTGTCSKAQGDCVYTPLPTGTACSSGAFQAGTCIAGACIGLTASLSQLVAGVAEPIVLHALFPPAAGGSGGSVQAYAATATGTAIPTQSFGELFDDGSAGHADAVAGDGIYSNKLSVSFASSGTAGIAAVMPGSGGSQLTATAGVNVLSADALPSAQQAAAAAAAELTAGLQAYVRAAITDSKITPESAIQRLYQALLTARKGKRAAAEAVAAAGGSMSGEDEVAAAAAAASLNGLDITQINANSLALVSERRLVFKTSQGWPCLVLATNGAENATCSGSTAGSKSARRLQQDGSGIDAASQQQPGEPAWSLPAAQPVARRFLLQQGCSTSRGKVLVLAPFFSQSNCGTSGSDEAAATAAAFQSAGYDVTFKCNDEAACPAGRPTLEDFTGWSAYAAVVVSSLGDSTQGGGAAIVVSGATLPAGSSQFAADWLSGRIVLTGFGGSFAITPEFFDKYGGSTASGTSSGSVGATFVYFSADRSARGGPTAPGSFSAALGASIPGAAGFAGISDYLSSRKFSVSPSPGVALARQLLTPGSDGLGAFALNGKVVDAASRATLAATEYAAGATLPDACASICSGVQCATTVCPDATAALTGAKQGFCSSLTGTCDTSCCGAADGSACTVRGVASTCSNGVCRDACTDGAFCKEGPCRKLAAPALCNPATGSCPFTLVADGTACSMGSTQGVCAAGACIDPCKNITCPTGPCIASRTCDPVAGTCSVQRVADGTACSSGSVQGGSCVYGVCEPTTPSSCSNTIETTTAPPVTVWGDSTLGRDDPTAAPAYTTLNAPTSACLPLTLAVKVFPMPAECAPTAVASLVVQPKGIFFMNCFAFSAGGFADEFSPVLGPALQIEPAEPYPGRNIYLTGVRFGSVQQVEECNDVLSLNIITSLGTTSLDLPCMPDTFGPHMLPGKGALLPAGERATIRFVGMTDAHVMSISRLFYTIY